MTTLSPVDVARYAQNAGFSGQALTNIVAIAGRESSFDPTAYNGSGLDNSVGLTQVNLIGSLLPGRIQILNQLGYNVAPNDEQTAIQLLQDPQINMDVAYALSNEGTNFSPWKMNSDPTSFLEDTDVPAAQQAVSQLNSSINPAGLGHIGDSAPMGVPPPSDPTTTPSDPFNVSGQINSGFTGGGGGGTPAGAMGTQSYQGGLIYIDAYGNPLLDGDGNVIWAAPPKASAASSGPITYGAPYIDPTTGQLVQQGSDGRIVSAGTMPAQTSSQVHYGADGSVWSYDPKTGSLTETAPPGTVGGASDGTVHTAPSGEPYTYDPSTGIYYDFNGQAITDPSYFTKAAAPDGTVHTAPSGEPYTYDPSTGIYYDFNGQAITDPSYFTKSAASGGYQHITAANGALLTYDPNTGQYIDPTTGQPISAQQAAAAAQKSPNVSISENIHSGGYNDTTTTDIGPNTLANDAANRAAAAQQAAATLAQQASQFAATNAINVANARATLADDYAKNLDATDPFAFNAFLMQYGGGNISNAIHALPTGALSQAALTPAAMDQQAMDQLGGASGGSAAPSTNPSTGSSPGDVTPQYAFGTKGKRPRDLVPPPKPPMRSGGRR